MSGPTLITEDKVERIVYSGRDNAKAQLGILIELAPLDITFPVLLGIANRILHQLRKKALQKLTSIAGQYGSNAGQDMFICVDENGNDSVSVALWSCLQCLQVFYKSHPPSTSGIPETTVMDTFGICPQELLSALSEMRESLAAHFLNHHNDRNSDNWVIGVLQLLYLSGFCHKDWQAVSQALVESPGDFAVTTGAMLQVGHQGFTPEGQLIARRTLGATIENLRTHCGHNIRNKRINALELMLSTN